MNKFLDRFSQALGELLSARIYGAGKANFPPVSPKEPRQSRSAMRIDLSRLRAWRAFHDSKIKIR